MNKKGFLLGEETLKIIIALVSISFLVYFMFFLYSSNRNSNDLNLAKESLNYIGEEIESSSLEILVYNPKSWSIMTWPSDFTSGMLFSKQTLEGIPKLCSNYGFEKCLCICPKKNPDECDKKGVCIESEYFISGEIKIQNPPIKLQIDSGGKTIK